MNKNAPERLTRWMLMCEAPESLPLEHKVQEDLAWAADHIAELKEVIQMCFDDGCKKDSKISKKTAIALMKHADTSA